MGHHNSPSLLFYLVRSIFLVSGKKKIASPAAIAKKMVGYHKPASGLENSLLSQVTIRGSIPPIQPAARLCGRVAALLRVRAGNSSANRAVCGPTTRANGNVMAMSTTIMRE